MPIPTLDHQGLLPVGTHDCSIDEIEVSFCWNRHRVDLFGSLKDFLIQKWHPLGVRAPLWIDGSFTRRKEVPADIDLVVDIAHLSMAEAEPVFALFLTRERIKVDYCVDFWVRHPAIPNDLTVFFCYAGLKAAAELGIDCQQVKGILRVNL